MCVHMCVCVCVCVHVCAHMFVCVCAHVLSYRCLAARRLPRLPAAEWDELKQHDVLFLLTIRPPDAHAAAAAHADGRTPNPAEKFGLVYVRGCEVIELRDEGGK